MSVTPANVGPMGRRFVAACDRCKRPLGHHPQRNIAEAIEADHLAKVHRITVGGDPDAA